MKRILIVEDSRVTREITKVYLIAKDVEVLEAVDGQEALEKIRASPPDLVLADLLMPRLDGAGLCAALAHDPDTRDLPVVILTASRDPAAIGRAVASGARVVLHKPIQPHELLDIMRPYLAPCATAAHLVGWRRGGRA